MRSFISIIVFTVLLSVQMSSASAATECVAAENGIYGEAKLKIDKNVTMNGNDVSSGDTDDDSITSTGATDNTNIPLTSMGSVAFGSTNITLNDGAELNPNSYGHVIVSKNADITMHGGDYYIDYFDVLKGAKIILDGPVTIHVGKFDLDENVEINGPYSNGNPVTTSGEAGNLTVKWYGGGTADNKFHFHDRVKFTGIVYSTGVGGNEGVKFHDDAKFFGGIFTDNIIKIGKKTEFTYGENEQVAAAAVLNCTAPAMVNPTVTSQTTSDTTPIIFGTYTSSVATSLTVTVNSVSYVLPSSELTNSGDHWTLDLSSIAPLPLGTYNVLATSSDGSDSLSDTTNNELVIQEIAMCANTTDSWWDPGWGNRVEIVFDNSASSESLSNFPVLISLTASDIIFSDTKDGGADIRFIGSDGSTLLDYEIEQWDKASGSGTVWVNVPTIPSGSTTDYIWMYYDNPAASSTASTAAWESGYSGVWHLNETAGNTSADATSNANNGTWKNSPVAGTGLISGGLDTRDKKTFVEISADNSIDLTRFNDWTISAWVKPTSFDGKLRWPLIYSYGTYRASLGLAADSAADGKIENWTNDSSVRHSNTQVPLNIWSYVVITRNASTTTFYLNGSVDRIIGSSTTVTKGNQKSYIGGNGAESDDLKGYLDEIRVATVVRSADWIEAQYKSQNNSFNAYCAETQSAAPAYFTISHDNSGIHCAAEPITVTARNADGSIATGYTGTIVLDTQSNDGTWSKAITTGFSDATANDGLASYTFAASDNGEAGFYLDYIEGDPNIDIDVYDGAIRDNDSEGNMVFAESGFTITRSVLSNPPPITIDYVMNNQIAGADFELHVAAYGTTATDTACGVIESYTGAKSISLTTARINPSTGVQEVTGSGDVDFTNGQAVITGDYQDVGKISVNVSDGTINGSSSDFIVKPDRFLVEVDSAVISTDESGDVFLAAGSNFTVTVTAQGFDGITAFTTPSYGNEEAPLVAESIAVSHLLVAPADGSAGILDNVDFSKTGAGIFSGDFTWNEVGIIDLTAAVADSDYLGAGDVVNTFSNLGRFIPAYFELVGATVTAANTSIANFTYLGQPVVLDYSLAARSALSPVTTTQNYQGEFAKLDMDSVSNALTGVGPDPGDQDVAYGVVDTITLASYNTRLSAVGPGVSTTWNAGAVNVIDLPLVIHRGMSTEGPVENIKVGLLLEDSDGVKFPVLDLDSNAAGGAAVDSKFLAPLPGKLLYGRASIPPAYGPEISLGSYLNIPFFIQYFDGSSFKVNQNDSSTAYGLWTASCTDADLSDGLLCAEAPVVIPMASVVGGAANTFSPIVIARPGPDNGGSLDITIAVDNWLKFDWDETSAGDEDPSSLVTFGIYRGHDRIVYIREVHNP